MPVAAISALDDAIARDAPESAYLLFGDNDLLKEETLRAVVARLVDGPSRDFNFDTFRGAEADAGSLSHALDALPLMASRRVVVVRDFPGLRKDARAVLDRYLAKPGRDTVLLLVAPAGWKPDGAPGGRVVNIEFAVFDERGAVKWLTQRAAESGMSITPSAARMLFEKTDGDATSMDAELRKLRDFAAGRTIGEDEVAAVMGTVAGKGAVDLVDMVCVRDGAGAALCVATALQQPKTTAVGIVMTLTAHLLGIGALLTDRARRIAPRQQESNLFTMMRQARGAAVGRAWGEAVKAMVRGADHWDRSGVDRALLLLADADSVLKETRVSGEEQILSTLVVTMCARSRPPRAA